MASRLVAAKPWAMTTHGAGPPSGRWSHAAHRSPPPEANVTSRRDTAPSMPWASRRGQEERRPVPEAGPPPLGEVVRGERGRHLVGLRAQQAGGDERLR